MSYQKGTVTANVLVGFNQDDMNALFDKNNESYGDITSLVEGNPNLFLFGYGSPRNILQMEHTYGQQPSNSGGGASTISIKFIDPEVEFENKFLRHSSMQAITLHKFANRRDPSKITQVDIQKSSYGDWWKEVYDEKTKAAREAEDAEASTRWVAWGPDAGGQVDYGPRQYHKTGDTPGEPSGGELKRGYYQELMNYGPWSAGDEKTRWSKPIKLVYSAFKPPSKPQAFYHTDIPVLSMEEEEEIVKATTAEVQQAIQSQANLMNGQGTAQVYVAYGMGYDFNSWAGPFSTTVMGATNEYDAKGVRSLAVTLVANTGQLGQGAREGVLGSGFGKKMITHHQIGLKDFNAFGQGKMEQRSTAEVQAVVDMYSAKYTNGFTEEWVAANTGVELSYGKDHTGLRPYEFLAEHVPGDIHTIIKTVLTKYLCGAISENNVPLGNIIVLMPDLTKGLKSVQANMLTDVLTNGLVRENNEGRAWTDMDQSLFENPEVNTEGEQEAAKGIAAKIHKDVTMQTVWGLQVLQRLLETLGFEFTMGFSENNSPRWDYLGAEKLDMRDGLSWSAYKEFDPYDDNWLIPTDERNLDWSNSLKHYFGVGGTRAGKDELTKVFRITITNRYDENQEETIYRVLSDISRNSSISMTPSLEWETDITILKMLEEHGVIETATQPACIFGDKRLLDKFVYGGIEFEKIFNEEGSINDFLRWVHPSDAERFSQPAEGGQGDGVAKSGQFPYCERVFSKLYGITEGAFDRLYLPHAEEAFADMKKAAAAGIPIFRSGRKNSNILSMKADLNPYWFAGLFIDNRKEEGRATTAGTGKVGGDKGEEKRGAGLTAEQIEKYLEYTAAGNLESLGGALEVLQSNVEEEFGFQISTIEDYRDFINFIANIQAGDNTKLPKNDQKASQLIISAEDPKSTFVRVKSMVDHIAKATIEASIKTLPYFKLSGTNCLARPVIMLVNEVQVANTPYYEKFSRGKSSAFSGRMYSGFWSLYGFKHFISNKEVYSEFTLFKQPESTPPEMGNMDDISADLKAEAIQASLEYGGVKTAEEIQEDYSAGMELLMQTGQVGDDSFDYSETQINEGTPVYGHDEILMAEAAGGDVSENLLNNIQRLKNPPKPSGTPPTPDP